MSDVVLRRAEQGDLPVLLDIYNHYVRETPITFDIEPRTLEQRQAWFDSFGRSGRYQCFVAVDGGRVLGWASSHRFRDRTAYDTTVETSIYLTPGYQGRGLGRRLYATLFDALAGEDVHRAYAGITQPNAASNRLHAVLGFREAGLLPEVGRKFGRFWDVAIWLRAF